MRRRSGACCVQRPATTCRSADRTTAHTSGRASNRGCRQLRGIDRSWADARPWLAAAAAALLAVSAFVIGRWSGAPLEPTRGSAAVHETSTDPRSVRERVVLAAVGDHFERAERALVELAHTTDEGHGGHRRRTGVGAAAARRQPPLSPVIAGCLVAGPCPICSASSSRFCWSSSTARAGSPSPSSARCRRASKNEASYSSCASPARRCVRDSARCFTTENPHHDCRAHADSCAGRRRARVSRSYRIRPTTCSRRRGRCTPGAPQRSTSATGRPPRQRLRRPPRSRASVRTPLSTGEPTRCTRAAAGRTPCRPSPRSGRPTLAADG